MEKESVQMKRLFVEADRCSGCRMCEAVCSFAHETSFASSTSRVTVFKEDACGFDLPVMCSHCSTCSSIQSCPTKALVRDRTGIVRVDEAKCTGCEVCVRKCRLEALRMHPKKHVPLICDLCGGKPVCVERCPTKALRYVDRETQQSSSAREIFRETLKNWGAT